MVTRMMIDFNHMNHAWPQRRIGKSHDLCRAVGLSKWRNLDILDATAGLARDAFILIKLGAKVTMLERHPTIIEAIQQALDEFNDSTIKARLSFYAQDALLFLQNCKNYDVIYLDPMFPEDNRTALAKKELQLLQDLIGHDDDSDKLLNLAKQKATQRVVVKRHKLNPYLAEETPSFSIRGKTTRYDVYLPM